MTEGYEAKYEDMQLTVEKIEMNDTTAVVAGNFSAKLTWKGMSGSDDVADLDTLEGSFQVEVLPIVY
jgi:hypothetical protein